MTTDAASILHDRYAEPESGFHWSAGLFFKRIPDGTVRLTWKLHNESEPRLMVFIPENEWASIVASVSANGETYATWQFIRAFHNGA